MKRQRTPTGARIRELRRAAGLKLADVSAHMGVSVSYMSSIEIGDRCLHDLVSINRLVMLLLPNAGTAHVSACTRDLVRLICRDYGYVTIPSEEYLVLPHG